jgi:hypothetical protein
MVNSMQDTIQKPVVITSERTAPIRFVTLRQQEVLRVDPTYCKLSVLAGAAYLLVDGQNTHLFQGQRVTLSSDRHLVEVSVLGQEPLVLELQGEVCCDTGERLPHHYRTVEEWLRAVL